MFLFHKIQISLFFFNPVSHLNVADLPQPHSTTLYLHIIVLDCVSESLLDVWYADMHMLRVFPEE